MWHVTYYKIHLNISVQNCLKILDNFFFPKVSPLLLDYIFVDSEVTSLLRACLNGGRITLPESYPSKRVTSVYCVCTLSLHACYWVTLVVAGLSYQADTFLFTSGNVNVLGTVTLPSWSCFIRSCIYLKYSWLSDNAYY